MMKPLHTKRSPVSECGAGAPDNHVCDVCDPANVAVLLRPDEAEFVVSAGRCGECWHLTALHNYHCCNFCMVPGCHCTKDGRNGEAFEAK